MKLVSVSISSSCSTGGLVERIRALLESRFSTSRAFMSASGRFGLEGHHDRDRGAFLEPARRATARCSSTLRVARRPVPSATVTRRHGPAAALRCPRCSTDLARSTRQLDFALAAGAEVAVIVAQLVQAPECQVERDAVQSALLAAKLVVKTLEVMRQLVDRNKPHDDRRALDAVKEAKRFLQGLRVRRVLLQAQQGVVQGGDMLVRLVEIKGHQLGDVKPRHHLLPNPTCPDAVHAAARFTCRTAHAVRWYSHGLILLSGSSMA